jgi:hypothetical protein
MAVDRVVLIGPAEPRIDCHQVVAILQEGILAEVIAGHLRIVLLDPGHEDDLDVVSTVPLAGPCARCCRWFYRTLPGRFTGFGSASVIGWVAWVAHDV